MLDWREPFGALRETSVSSIGRGGVGSIETAKAQVRGSFGGGSGLSQPLTPTTTPTSIEDILSEEQKLWLLDL